MATATLRRSKTRQTFRNTLRDPRLRNARWFRQRLLAISACSDAVEFCAGKTLAQAWRDTDNGYWLQFWLQELPWTLKQKIALQSRIETATAYAVERQREEVYRSFSEVLADVIRERLTPWGQPRGRKKVTR